jgi:hypothetical protein
VEVDTHNRYGLTWNQRWKLLLSILNTSWKAMKELKEVTCSVVLSPSSGNHWNTAGGTGICSYCVSKCVSRLLSLLCGWDPSLPIFAVFSLKCMSMCDMGVQLLWCVCVCVRERERDYIMIILWASCYQFTCCIYIVKMFKIPYFKWLAKVFWI